MSLKRRLANLGARQPKTAEQIVEVRRIVHRPEPDVPLVTMRVRKKISLIVCAKNPLMPEQWFERLPGRAKRPS